MKLQMATEYANDLNKLHTSNYSCSGCINIGNSNGIMHKHRQVKFTIVICNLF